MLRVGVHGASGSLPNIILRFVQCAAHAQRRVWLSARWPGASPQPKHSLAELGAIRRNLECGEQPEVHPSDISRPTSGHSASAKRVAARVAMLTSK
jgi:hypothetical protein